MRTPVRGRPQASSREVLADAALELFLEQGYEATSIVDITRRAGVSRASFFNYFVSKSETLWLVLDGRLDELTEALEHPDASLEDALAAVAEGDRPDALALAIVDARTMGAEQELWQGRAERQLRIGAAVSARISREGALELDAEILGAAYSAAIFAAVWQWAARGSGKHSLDAEIEAALGSVRALLG